MPPCAPLTLALYEPDIAPNAGAMLRTCACFAADAAIIEPAGFVALRPAPAARRHGLPRRADDRPPRFVRAISSLARRRRPPAGAAHHQGRDGAVGFRLPARRRHPGRARIGGRPRDRSPPRPTRACASRSRRRCARSTSRVAAALALGEARGSQRRWAFAVPAGRDKATDLRDDSRRRDGRKVTRCARGESD